ncbi:MAG: S8 family serine peptidase [Synechococcaceae cyanobacterium]|nr:S8 family serine peptidase [Synechococcaceae cyanobacterium]
MTSPPLNPGSADRTTPLNRPEQQPTGLSFAGLPFRAELPTAIPSETGPGSSRRLNASATGAPDQSDPAAPPASGAPGLAERLVIHWHPSSTAAERSALHLSLGVAPVRSLDAASATRGGELIEVVELPAGLSAAAAMRAYAQQAGVRSVELDALARINAISNDPYYTNPNALWGMYSTDSTAAGPSGTTNSFGSQAEQAWLQGYTGSSKVVAGVVDTGIDYTHPDLYLNIWLNPGEIRTLDFYNQLTDSDTDGLITFRDLNDSRNASFVQDVNGNARIDAGDLLNDSRWEDGLDNDGNGRRDDLIGWDFYNNSNDPYRPSDGDQHGTHVAGTIGGLGGNGLGVAGVNWNIQIMALKFLGPNGGYTSDAAAAVNYYANMTTRHDVDYGGVAQYVGTNNSWGGGGYLSSLHTAIVNGGRVGNLFVAAAGNSAASNDVTMTYPANYSTLTAPSGTQALSYEAVVSVASITSSGSLSSFSNYGAQTVDIGAPGSAIISTVPNAGYASYSGTSMASPHVLGGLALMSSAHPTATPQQLLQALYSGATPTSSLSGRTASGGRLNLDASLSQLASLVGGVTPPPTSDPPRQIWGTTGSDVLTGTKGGGSGADSVTGVTAKGTRPINLGLNQIDKVTGGLGADRFLTADSRGQFYNDGKSSSSGFADYLWILDFNPEEGDQLVVRSSSQYIVHNITIDNTPFTDIYIGNGDMTFSAADELIATFQGLSLAPGTGPIAFASASWLTRI